MESVVETKKNQKRKEQVNKKLLKLILMKEENKRNEKLQDMKKWKLMRKERNKNLVKPSLRKMRR